MCSSFQATSRSSCNLIDWLINYSPACFKWLIWGKWLTGCGYKYTVSGNANGGWGRIQQVFPAERAASLWTFQVYLDCEFQFVDWQKESWKRQNKTWSRYSWDDIHERLQSSTHHRLKLNPLFLVLLGAICFPPFLPLPLSVWILNDPLLQKKEKKKTLGSERRWCLSLAERFVYPVRC